MRKKLSLILLLLVLAAAMVFIDDRLSSGAAAVNLNRLPIEIGQWKGHAYPPDERIMRILGTEYILDRDYVNPDQRRLHANTRSADAQVTSSWGSFARWAAA